MNSPVLNDQGGYGMRLANGQEWHIMAIDGLRPWVARLASIMQLNVYQDHRCPKMIFVRESPERAQYGDPVGRLGKNIGEELARRGWKVHGYNMFRVWSHCDVADVICEIGRGDQNLENVIIRQSVYPIYQRAQESGGLPFHAALVIRDGVGVLLAARKKTGKSTCCLRLPPSWLALCDEETLVVQNDQGRYMAHPFPTWSDHLRQRSERTWDVQQHVPLSALFFLEKAEADNIVPIGQGEAAVYINYSAMQVLIRNWCYLAQEEVRHSKIKLFGNACELARAVPAYRLGVSLKGRFWEEMEKVL